MSFSLTPLICSRFFAAEGTLTSASSRCSTETNSSFIAAASLSAASSTCIRILLGCGTLPPELLTSRLSSPSVRRASCWGLAPIFSRTGFAIPSTSCSTAASRCNGSSSGFPRSPASDWAFCSASWALRVSLSRRKAMAVILEYEKSPAGQNVRFSALPSKKANSMPRPPGCHLRQIAST